MQRQTRKGPVFVSSDPVTAEREMIPGSAGSRTGRGPWRAGVISNPLSGGNRRRGLGAVYRCLQNHPEVPHREVRTAEDVRSVLTEFGRMDINLVAVNSGDGTVQAVLTSLFVDRPFRLPPLLALLSGGTTNMTHKELGLTGSREDALQRLMAWVHHGDGSALIRRRNVLRVQPSSDSRPVYGMFLGAACIYKGIQFFHSRVQQLGLRGDSAHLLIIGRFLMALARRDDALVAPLTVGIRADGCSFQKRNCLVLLVTTLDRLILGLRPFWHGAGGPLRLTAVDARPRRLIRALPALINGRPGCGPPPGDGYLSCSARDIRLEMKGGFAVDGEVFNADTRSGPVRVEDGGEADFLRL
jgi:hypothetical protein